MNFEWRFFLLLLSTTLLQEGCVLPKRPKIQRSEWESVVLVGEQSSSLAHFPLKRQPLVIRNSYFPKLNAQQYEVGRDFIVDFESGSLRRTSNSRIPDFGTNVLFGKEDFDHSNFPGYGNGEFFVFVDYSFAATNHWPIQERQEYLLKKTRARLRAGESVKIVAFGDSITAGGEATQPNLIYWRRWSEDLKRKYPSARITTANAATGGDSTVQGLERLREKVLAEKPDLVLIAFGMNDHNIGGVPIPQFRTNMEAMIGRIRERTSAEIILLSAFPPNPKWHYGSHQMEKYATATRRVARENSCAYADVFDNWVELEQRKKPEDLLGNNINHPNDFGHWIYFRVLQELGL